MRDADGRCVVIALFGFAAVIVGAVSAVGLALAGCDTGGAWLLAGCGVVVVAVAHRAPRWWP